MAEKAKKIGNDLNLDAVFAALSYPMMRHMVLLLALAPRTSDELSEHFDVTPQRARSVAEMLCERGLASQTETAGEYRLNEKGLGLVKDWLAEIDSGRGRAIA